LVDLIDPSLSWRDVAWIRSLSDLPLVIKGILDPADASQAVEHGAAGNELQGGGIGRGFGLNEHGFLRRRRFKAGG
jgi:isopentenyl diphosphate isomerase/L-lactate dehydrogenase-like FMN-dependent dehydrogenase